MSPAARHDPKEDRARVRAYFAELSPPVRKRVRQMRDVILAAVPQAVESFSYGMPGFRLGGKVLVWYAAFKQHTSLFPITAAIRRRFARELKGYETAKGTVRFPLDQPLSASLVKALVRARVAEVRP